MRANVFRNILYYYQVMWELELEYMVEQDSTTAVLILA